MNSRWKERLITAGLWLALIIVTGYVTTLLFPTQIGQWKQKIERAVKDTVGTAVEELTLEQNKLSSYLLNPSEEASLFDHVTPIVTYMMSKRDKEPSAAQSKTGSSLPSEEIQTVSSSAPSPLPAADAQDTEPTAFPKATEIQSTSPSSAEESTELPTDAVAAVNPIVSGGNILPRIMNLVSEGKYSAEQLMDYNYLKGLYVIDSNTNLPPEILNPSKLLTKDLSLKGDNSKPQILIYHTHSQEAFADSVPGDVSQTIVGVGDYLTDLLTNTYGFQVLHHKGVYDMTDGKLDRDHAYVKALPDLAKILQENPSIEVVIDLHRDGVKEDVHLVTDIDGKPVAKLMFFNGLCRNREGDRTDVTNSYREDNLSFSLQMALMTKAYYPELFRVIYVRPNQYNQHLCPRSALIECGAQTNTVAEVMNTMPILAEMIAHVLKPQ